MTSRSILEMQRSEWPEILNRVHRKSFSFAKMGRFIMLSREHMITFSILPLSHLHLQAVEECTIVLLVTIFRTDVSSSQYNDVEVERWKKKAGTACKAFLRALKIRGWSEL